jgi:hypothetical protein
MRRERATVLAWAVHLGLSLALVVFSVPPGWQDLIVPGTLSPAERVVVIAARVLTTPVFPLAELVGIPIWRGFFLAVGLAFNSAIWVLALGWLQRRMHRAGG